MVIMIILLILCLPLILMLSLFTTTNVVTIVADVPVTGIVLNMDKSEIPVLSLDDGDTMRVDYAVTPNGATNKEVTYSFSPIGEEKMAEFEVEENLLTPTSHGKTKVTVETVDGGFRDSFIVYVTTRRVTAIDCVPERDTIFVGETTVIDTMFTPQNAANQSLSYSIKEGDDVVTIQNGRIKGIGLGTAIIEVTSGDDPEVKDEIVINVVSSGVFDYVETDEFIMVDEVGSYIDVVLNPELGNISHTVTLKDITGIGEPVDPATTLDVVFNREEGRLEYEFKELDFIGTIEVLLSITPEGGETVKKACTITRLSEVKVAWGASSTKRAYGVFHNEDLNIEIDVQPKIAKVVYKVTVDFTAGTDLAGTVNPGDEIVLEEGVKYTCKGGYVSFMLLNNTIVIHGEKTAESMDKISETETSLRVYVSVEGAESESIRLGTKKITVSEPFS